jgi:hypothetical protein
MMLIGIHVTPKNVTKGYNFETDDNRALKGRCQPGTAGVFALDKTHKSLYCTELRLMFLRFNGFKDNIEVKGFTSAADHSISFNVDRNDMSFLSYSCLSRARWPREDVHWAVKRVAGEGVGAGADGQLRGRLEAGRPAIKA